MDLHGKLVGSGCEKELSHEDLVRIISSLGKPSVIAADVSPAPDFVMRIASRFHIKLFVPDRNLRVEEKKKIGKEIQNPHIRDAYAAAVKAYRNYDSTLLRIEKSDTVLHKGLIKHLVLQGHSAAEAEFMLTKKEEKKTEHIEKKASPQKQKRDERVLSLLEETENLRKALEMERESRKNLEEKLKKSTSSRTTEVSRDREVQRLQGQVARLQTYITRLKRRKKKK